MGILDQSMNHSTQSELSEKGQEMLHALETAVAHTLEKKCRLGHALSFGKMVNPSELNLTPSI